MFNLFYLIININFINIGNYIILLACHDLTGKNLSGNMTLIYYFLLKFCICVWNLKWFACRQRDHLSPPMLIRRQRRYKKKKKVTKGKGWHQYTVGWSSCFRCLINICLWMRCTMGRCNVFYTPLKAISITIAALQGALFYCELE